MQFAFEAKNDLLARALNKFGEVKDVFNRCWFHLSGVADGVRVVSMVRNQAIPRNLDVEGFRVRFRITVKPLSVTFVNVWVMLLGIVR